MHGSRIPHNLIKQAHEALKRFTDLLHQDKYTFEMKLQPGQCVIFENRRVVHARRQFTMESGERWLAGAYVDEDALLSRFRVCNRDQTESWLKPSPPKWSEGHTEFESSSAGGSPAEEAV
jgi:hypothetical protein